MPQFIEMAICAQENLLHNILRVNFVFHLLTGVGEDHLLIPVYEYPEGVAIACQCLGH